MITEAHEEITQLRLTSRMSTPECAQELWKKELKWGPVYPEARLKGMSIEGIHESIRQIFRNVWWNHDNADLKNLERYAKEMESLGGRPSTVSISTENVT